LKTQKLTKKYGTFSAVDNMDIQVNKGDIYGLVGKNGAGKTTLLKMLCGLSVPTQGEFELFSQKTEKGLNEIRAKTGSIIETPSFLPYLSAEKNLEYYRIQRGIQNKNCVKESLQFVGLADTGKKKFKNFSLGMKQRLGLALAIMNDPDLLILDEPINGLDPMGIAEFRETLLKLNHEKNTTIIISSHILGELSQIATTYGFMNSGRLVEHISVQDLHEKCKRQLKIQVDDTNKAANILQKELSCTNIQIENEHDMLVADQLDAPEKMVRALVLNNVMVSEVRQTGLNLEEYFIQLVGGMQNA
jgi:ABC-2 type transport system ATP-binding protein